MEVPFSALSPAAQAGLIDELILREGTDYGDVEVSLDAKRRQVRAQIAAGEVIVTFDPETETCGLAMMQPPRCRPPSPSPT